MSKKHFKAFAAALLNNRPGENWDKRVQWNQDVKAIAAECRQFNSNFDYHRFIDACGGLFNV